ncbi:tripartite tricarboxylate transporter TctB family protein [Imbroritus primus]|uniref:tripartite tricarboxylate transporter TctB family protein n=1 Tax=Imbroritus primus TaxID=3058603 RepID=UPI003D16047C
MITIKAPKDFCAGLSFILISGVFLYVAQDYPRGSALQMGPAYFPTALAGLLFLIGCAVLLRSLVIAGERVGALAKREMVLILGALVVFGALINTAGLIASCAALLVIGSLASGEFRWREVAVFIVALTTAAILIFYYALGLPFKLGPWS